MTPKHVIQKIEKAYKEKATFLDLGNCGLTEIPEDVEILAPFLGGINLGRSYGRGNQIITTENSGPENNLSGTSINADLFESFKKLSAVHLNHTKITFDNIDLLGSIPNLLSLDISNNELNGIPPTILRHLKLRILNAAFNRITDAGIQSIRAENLIELKLNNNNITDAGAKSISQLRPLRVLNLGKNVITDAGMEYISSLSNLANLSIESCHITDQGMRSISKLLDLSELNTSSNDVTSKGVEMLRSLPKLSELNISSTKIGDIGMVYISYFNNLRHLYVDSNQINDKIAQYIAKLVKLSRLSIYGNSIADNGIAAISQLHELEYLNIGKNELTDSGVKHLASLIKLKDLYLDHNKITDQVAPIFSKLTRLKRLGLNSTEINDETAKSISDLPELTYLHLSFTQVSDEGVKALSKLSKLESLFASNIQLTEKGAKYISRLTSLKTLFISFNKNIGDRGIAQISKLTNLKSLAAGECNISDEGFKAICTMKNLESLFVDTNNITDDGITDIFNLAELRNLSISSNQLTDKGIPIIVNTLNQLIYLNSAENKTVTIPPEILIDITALRAFFKSSEQVDNNLVKMVLIGNTTAGKTSLANFLTNKQYQNDIERTHGIRLWKWSTGRKKTDLTVNVWDFGGQDYYHATHNIFLDDKTLYLFLHTAAEVHNQRASSNQYLSPSYWLGNIRSYTRNDTVIWYIQSKADTGTPLFLDSDLSRNYNVINQFQISVQGAAAKESHRIAQFNYFKGSLILELSKLARGKLPVSWVTIRDQHLPNWRKDVLYLSIEEFRQKCKDALSNNASYAKDLELSWDGLLPYLKGCGEVIYFPEASNLTDIIFLSAESLTNGIYKILSEKVLQNDGIFTLSTLEEEDRQHAKVYLQVLLAYELIFERPGSPGTYVAPQYLPFNAHTKHFQQLIKVAYVIHFPHYMSRSLITRFLVKYASTSEDNYYWKYGAFFKLSDLNIFVRIDADMQKVYVHVEEGNSSSRYYAMRELFFFFTIPFNKERLQSKTEKLLPEQADIIKEKAQQSSRDIDAVPGEIELSIDDMNFAPIAKLREAIENKAHKIKSEQDGYIQFNAVIHQLLNTAATIPKKIFLSYSHKDEQYKQELDVHFAALKLSGKVETWNDRKILAGDDWDQSIKKALEEADIAILLLSPDFMASDYIWNTEIRHAIDKGIKIVPVFLRPCYFKESVFEIYKRQGLPSNVKWIISSGYQFRDEGYLEVVKGITSLLDAN